MNLDFESLNHQLRTVFKEEMFISSNNCQEIGNALVIAPHPDDESLGCGGTVALLRNQGFSVQVIFVTDGSKSHPFSKSYPPERLRKLREKEGIKALNILGVNAGNIHFLRLPDSELNELNQLLMVENRKTIQKIIKNFFPNTILLPWRNDPHPDHIATWKLCYNAIQKLPKKIQLNITILEYLVWFWERTKPDDLGPNNSIKLWRVAIDKELKKKKQAIEAHESQMGKIIMDIPDGFCISSEMLDKFLRPEELFLEYKDFLTKI